MYSDALSAWTPVGAEGVGVNGRLTPAAPVRQTASIMDSKEQEEVGRKKKGDPAVLRDVAKDLDKALHELRRIVGTSAPLCELFFNLDYALSTGAKDIRGYLGIAEEDEKTII